MFSLQPTSTLTSWQILVKMRRHVQNPHQASLWARNHVRIFARLASQSLTRCCASYHQVRDPVAESWRDIFMIQRKKGTKFMFNVFFPYKSFNIIYYRCLEFAFGGCKGNINNFDSPEDCEYACKGAEEKVVASLKSAICSLPKVKTNILSML